MLLQITLTYLICCYKWHQSVAEQVLLVVHVVQSGGRSAKVSFSSGFCWLRRCRQQIGTKSRRWPRLLSSASCGLGQVVPEEGVQARHGGLAPPSAGRWRIGPSGACTPGCGLRGRPAPSELSSQQRRCLAQALPTSRAGRKALGARQLCATRSKSRISSI